jgi:hypothetical protein
MAKRDGLIDKLPRRPAIEKDEVKFQDEVDAAKLNITDRRPAALAATWRDLRVAQDELEEHAKELEILLEAHKQVMDDAYDVEDLDSLRLTDGDSVGKEFELSAVVTDGAALRRWCFANKLSDGLTLPWARLNALVKDLLKSGQPLPDGVKPYSRVKFVWR